MTGVQTCALPILIEFDTNDVITTSSDLGGEKPGLTDVIDVNGIKNWSDFIE